MSDRIKMNIVNQKGISMDIKPTGGGSSKTIRQVYIGDDEPTDPEILIWIDTSGDVPTVGTKLMTSDNKEFITANNENFILKEV